MKISKRGVELIKSFEGCVLTAYKDAVGVWTIGYGHTKGVKQGQTISEQEAENLLKADCKVFEDNVNKYNDIYHWNQNEFDSLVSFAFNIGSINQLTGNGTRTKAVIADKMLEYNKAGGRVLEGLKRRREKERELFLSPSGISPAEVVQYALSAKEWIYVWGADGKEYTEEYANALYEAYGSSTYSKEYYEGKLREGRGKTAADCSGFLYPLSGADNTADGYYRACIEKGKIEMLPQDTVCLVFKANSAGNMHHVGIYLGNDNVAEMKSSQDNYQLTGLEGQGYTHWGKPVWIDYRNNEGEWEQENGAWRYKKPDGRYAADEWIFWNGQYYVFDGAGNMIKGWFKENLKDYYYMNIDGAMLADQWTGPLEGGKEYFLTPSGKMAVNAYIKSRTKDDLYHFVGADGAWVPEKDLICKELSIY